MVDFGAETGTVAQGRKLKKIARSLDLAQQGNPGRVFGALETAEEETLDETDSEADNVVMK